MIEPTPSLNALVEQAASLLRTHFHTEPAWKGIAPGRVNLIGEHTDYNQGWVLPIAIDRYTVLAAAPGAVPDEIRVFSASLGEQAALSLHGIVGQQPQGWMRYVEGMVAEYRGLGVICPALDMVIVSSVPVGSGLSSSAALELALAHVIEAATEQAATPEARIGASIRAERTFAGVPCGVMDQTVAERASAGHALLLDCQDNTFSNVPFFGPQASVLVIHSGITHELASGAYATRRAECKAAAERMGGSDLRSLTAYHLKALDAEPTLLKRARHVMTENARVRAMVAALTSGDDRAAGALLSESHESLRDDFEVSCEAVDQLVTLAEEEEGVLGARMTGGGFGGCVIALVRCERLDTAATAICRRYTEYTGRPTLCFTVNAVAGAGEMDAPV
jgi:galactokinase